MDESIILLYHGVTDSPCRLVENFSKKHLPFEEFERQIRCLAERHTAISLRTMAETLEKDESPGKSAVAVTFDDGYENVCRLALPVLEAYQVPATFFLSTGFVGGHRLYWTDEVEDQINRCRKEKLRLSSVGWAGVWSLATPALRIKCIAHLKNVLKASLPKNRDTLIEELRQACLVSPLEERYAVNYRQLSWEMARRLDSSPLFEVGGHTVNHEIMSYLDDEALAWEIDGCLDTLEKELDRRVDLFSYPEGQAEHYSQRVIDALKSRGIRICPSAIDGGNHPGADPFHLKRIMIGFMGRAFPFPLQ